MLESADYEALAEVRHRIRRFLVFSEAKARSVGVEPQQHQLMLAVRGLPAGLLPTVGVLAQRLQVQHHTAVELVNRSCENGLVDKRTHEKDRRQVLVGLTAKGRRLLEKLTLAHREELRETAPALIGALDSLLAGAPR